MHSIVKVVFKDESTQNFQNCVVLLYVFNTFLTLFIGGAATI